MEHKHCSKPLTGAGLDGVAQGIKPVGSVIPAKAGIQVEAWERP